MTIIIMMSVNNWLLSVFLSLNMSTHVFSTSLHTCQLPSGLQTKKCILWFFILKRLLNWSFWDGHKLNQFWSLDASLGSDVFAKWLASDWFYDKVPVERGQAGLSTLSIILANAWRYVLYKKQLFLFKILDLLMYSGILVKDSYLIWHCIDNSVPA